MTYQYDKDFTASEAPVIDEPVETWKYGEGQYDYLANAPGYGYHGDKAPQRTSSPRKPWVHYYIVDNIKYVVVMVVFYFLFMAHLDNIGMSAFRQESVEYELFSAYTALTSLLFWKSTWRLFRMR